MCNMQSTVARIDQIVQQASGAVELQEAVPEQQMRFEDNQNLYRMPNSDCRQRRVVRTSEVEASDERTS